MVLAIALLVGRSALACDAGTNAYFACEAANGRKFIELCGTSPMTQDGSLVYRFGSITKNGDEQVELEYPKSGSGSLARFAGATYTHRGIYTQSVRFESGPFSYTVFTRARGAKDLEAGVEVRDRRGGRSTTISCGERPRFYIFDLKDFLACDPHTPAGKACIR
jgi:hypothetical protein